MTAQRDDMASPDDKAADANQIVLDDPAPAEDREPMTDHELAGDRILLDDPVPADDLVTEREPLVDREPLAGRAPLVGPEPVADRTPAPGQVPVAAADTPDTIPAAALAEQQWPAIQSLFVDDPRGAVERAAGAAGEVAASLVATLEREQAELRASWQQDADTERLRTALQRYRAFCGRLEGLA